MLCVVIVNRNEFETLHFLGYQIKSIQIQIDKENEFIKNG